MTEYRTLQARKRDFTIRATIQQRSDVLYPYTPDTRITREGNTRITRGGNTRVARTYALFFTLKAKKRNFSLRAEVKHG